MDGGAVFGFFSARIRIQGHVVLSNNMASAGGGAIGAKGWEDYMIAGGYWFFVAQPSTVSVTGSVQCRGNEALVGGCLWVSDRAAADVGGAAVLEHNSARTGGGASVDFDASLAVSGHAAWRANAAREGGGIVVSGQGVGVNVSGAATFERNRAEVAPALLPCRPLPALIPPAILRRL